MFSNENLLIIFINIEIKTYLLSFIKFYEARNIFYIKSLHLIQKKKKQILIENQNYIV